MQYNDINLHFLPKLVLRTSSIVPSKHKFLGRTSLLYEAVIHHFLAASSCLKWRRRNASFRSQNRWKIVGCHIWWYGGRGNTSNLHSDFVPRCDGLHDVGRCLAANSGQKKNCFFMLFLTSRFQSRSLYLPLPLT